MESILLTKEGIQPFVGTLMLGAILMLLAAGHVKAQPSGHATNSINVTEFSFTPSTIDSTDSSQTVTITVRVTDTERDIWLVGMVFKSPVIEYHLGFEADDRIFGNARDAVYRKTFTFHQYSDVGTWTVSNVRVYDGTLAYYRWRELDTYYLAARGFPTELRVINNNEAVPPEISEFSFTPSTIDGTRNVTVTLRARDVASGVTSIAASFTNPPDCYFYDDDCGTIGVAFTSADRISGDERDGVYRRTINISTNVPPGIYTANISATDGVRNRTWLYSNHLAALGFPVQLQINAPVVSISGRILKPDGRGMQNVSVRLMDSQGITILANTSSFGYFVFENIRPGGMYSVTVGSKRYHFETRSMFVGNDLTLSDIVGRE